MLLFENYGQYFYSEIKKDYVLIIANVDADAVCTAKILLELFHGDDVPYTLVPVDGWESFHVALREHATEAQTVVLVNCGATISLVPFLRNDMTFYVIDTRRPLNLTNIYYGENIRVLVSKDEWEQLDIPNYDEIEVEDSSSEDDDIDEEDEREGGDVEEEAGEASSRMEEGDETIGSQTSGSEMAGNKSMVRDDEVEEDSADELQQSGSMERREGYGGGRKRRISDVAASVVRRELKRRRRIEAKRRREDVLWRYLQNSWYAPSSAVLMLEVANSIGRSTIEMMWSAVVGLSSQLVEYLISHDCYTTVCFDRLRPFRMKFCTDGSNILRGDDIVRLKFDDEIMLPLYEHWSLYTSMLHNDFFFCQTRIWQQSGVFIMKTLLAELEITLEESYKVYHTLPLERKNDIFQRIYKEMDEQFASFKIRIGFGRRYNSCDFARAIAGRMSYGIVHVESPYDRFSGARDVLDRFLGGKGDDGALSKAIESYKGCLVTVVNLVSTSITDSLIVSTGSFYLLSLPKEDQTSVLHCRHFLNIFVHYVHQAFITSSRSKNRTSRPLFVAVPMSGERSEWFLFTGAMPMDTNYEDFNQKSFIGRALQRVADNFLRSEAQQDYFDPTIVMIHSDQKSRFLDGLQSTLEIE